MSALTLLEPGALFARDFRIVRPLADGGMSSVYVAEQRSSGKMRALKVLSGEYLRDAQSRAQFAEEARIGGMIQSGNVVEVIAAGIDEETDLPWMAMELLEGEDLADLVQRRGRLPLHEAREILEQLGDALSAAHDAGVIHRDLKPRNIFVARSQLRGMPFVVKVLDFGISKLIDRSATSVGITRQLGSPLFMAPEQARSGARLRRSTDIWPLGLLAYFLLTGKYYWKAVTEQGVNLNALLLEIAVEPIAAPSERAAMQKLPAGTIPDGFDGWFLRCVAREPEGRYPDARAAMEGLSAALQRVRRGFDEGSEPTTVRRLPDETDDSMAPTETVRRPDTMVAARAVKPVGAPTLPPLATSMAVGPSGSFVSPVSAGLVTTEPPGSSVGSLIARPAPTPRPAEATHQTANGERRVPKDEGRGGNRTVLIAALGVALVATGVGYVLAGYGRNRTATTATAPLTVSERQNVSLRFSGLPQGARVTVAGVPFYSDTAFAPRGASPVQVRIEASGYQPTELTVVPEHDQQVAVPPMQASVPVVAVVPTVVAQPLAVPDAGAAVVAVPTHEPAERTAHHGTARSREAGMGTLVVGADPPRCEVFVDGRRVGVTPIFAHSVSAGEHRVVCRRQGVTPSLRVVRVERGGEREVVFPAP